MDKKEYHKSIALQCATCGAEYAFSTDKNTGVVTCLRCNRVYYGGYNEIVKLNQKSIYDEAQQLVSEVKADVKKELINIFKKTGMNIK